MKCEKGFTFIEIVIGLAITGVLATVVAAAIPLLMQWLPRQANKLGVEADLTLARYYLTADANAAENFISLSTPQYGYFQWRDFSTSPMVTYKVTYRYDSATQSLIREERQNDVVQSSLPVARRILNQTDAQFTWSPATSRLTVSITATIEDAPGVGTSSRNATIVATLRPRVEPLVSPPGEVPTLPPPPGSVSYYVSGEPTIISGTWLSGNGASLHDVDNNFYVVDSVLVPGAKLVRWSVVSEVMTTPTTISQIEVRFTSKASQKNVAMEFYVKDSDAGFPATPASGFTFTQADTIVTHTFYLDAATLAYVNSLPERRVTLKVEATVAAIFNLSTEQVLCIASP